MPTQADNTMRRCQVIKTHDDDDQQKMEAYGFFNERYGGTSPETATPRLQEYGYSSYVPEGSQGLTQTPNGNPDMAFITKVMDPKTRWKKLTTQGVLVEYDKWESRRMKEQTQWTDVVGTAKVLMLRSGGVVHLNPPSSVTKDWAVHRDNSKMSPGEIAELEAMEEKAEANRQQVLAEAQGRHDIFIARIDRMEQRIAQLETEVALLTNHSQAG